MSITPLAIEFRQNRAGQARAYVSGSNVRVLDIYALSELQGLSPDEIANAKPTLTLGQVHTALGYLIDHRNEIVAQFHEELELANASRAATGPGPLAKKLQERGGDDALPF